MKPVLVFLHGMGGSASSWKAQDDAFGAEHRVLCWNVPGYGGRPLLDEFTFETLAAQLITDLDAFGIQRVIPVGHSFGGMIAQQLVRDYPDRVHALVLSGTSPAFGKPDGDFQQRFVASRLEPLDRGESLADMAGATVASLIGEDPDPAGVELALKGMSAVPPETYRAVVKLIVTFDLRANLENISCPSCFIAGERDTTAPAAMMERMAGKVHGSAFRTLPGAGHLANMERPTAFNDVLGAFLRSIQHV